MGYLGYLNIVLCLVFVNYDLEMSLLKRTFEQLKIAEMNDAKTKPSLISPSFRLNAALPQTKSFAVK